MPSRAERSPSTSETSDTIKVASPLAELTAKAAAGIVLRGIDHNIMRTMKPEFPQGFKEKFLEEMMDEKTISILVSSHQGHADAAQTAVVSKHLTYLARGVRERFPGFVLIFAASVRSGHQGTLLREGFLQAEKHYGPKYNLRFLDVVRQTDIEKYGMKPNHFPFLRAFGGAIKDGEGIAVYPEASVQGGRLKEGEESGSAINGMQRFDPESLNFIIRTLHKQEKRPLFLPMGSHGAFRIVDSNSASNKVTPREFLRIFGPRANKLVSANLGMPLRYEEDIVEDLKQQGITPTKENVADYLGRKVAELLPEDARGVYAS